MRDEEENRMAQHQITDVASLLDDVAAFVRRYVILPVNEAYDAVALWIFHTHAFEAANFTPYLYITGPDPECGKTRVLEVVRKLVKKPWYTTSVTGANLARTIDHTHPVLLHDEIDKAFAGSKEEMAKVTAILNSGFQRGGSVSILLPAAGGWASKEFDVFCPKALAGIDTRQFPDTLKKRSIRFGMKRKLPEEKIELFLEEDVQKIAGPIRLDLADAAEALVPDLIGAKPAAPAELGDRAQDSWRPLFAIADLAGGSWSERARRAALVLSTGADSESVSEGILLLTHVHTVFDQKGLDKISTAVLLQSLNANESWPWGNLRGKALEAIPLAAKLRPYEIGPRDHWIEGSAVKGYERSDFYDAWRRYCPSPTSSPEGAIPARPARGTNVDGDRLLEELTEIVGTPPAEQPREYAPDDPFRK